MKPTRTRAPRLTIGEHAAAVMRKEKCTVTWWGDIYLMERIAARACIGKDDHPLTRIRKVVRGMERSPLFEVDYMLGADSLCRNRRCLRFRLKARNPGS